MKDILKTLVIILSFLGIFYILLSVGNGSFDFAQWNESVRTLFGVAGGMGTVWILASKWLVGW